MRFKIEVLPWNFLNSEIIIIQTLYAECKAKLSISDPYLPGFSFQEVERCIWGKISTITRLACGIPAGGDLEYVDDVTLMEAFYGRHTIKN